jgi:hypothetical protein
MGSSNFGQTILGEAVKAAVGDAATQLDNKAATFHCESYGVGLVADVSETLDHQCGQQNGVELGIILISAGRFAR